jgi:hypothetical protein
LESFENCEIESKNAFTHNTQIDRREFDNKLKERYARAIGQELTQAMKKYILQHSVHAEKGS